MSARTRSVVAAEAAAISAARRLLLDNLDEIRRIVDVACGRGLAHEREDCFAWILVRLVDEDFERLRQYRGESPGRKFLRVVVLRLVRDYRISVWGRWAPSSRAQKLGYEAMRLERLIWRDGHTSEDAVAIAERSSQLSAAELQRLVEQLPVRTKPRLVHVRLAEDVESAGGVEGRLAAARQLVLERELERHLREILAGLEPSLRRLLRSHYRDGEKISVIARRDGKTDTAYYWRLRRCLRSIRAELRRRGLDAEAIEDLRWADLRLSFNSLMED
jgi:DNA-directed RNA polymerase specialized sigma24 family protein